MPRQPQIDVIRRSNDLRIDVGWPRLLAVAIVVRAWLDLKALNEQGGSLKEYSHCTLISRAELDRFFESPWCSLLLTGAGKYDPEYVKEKAQCVIG